jgi:hypothetical protein
MTCVETLIAHPNLVEKFTNFLCSELDITPTRITIAPYEDEAEILGLCLDESETEFILLIKENDRDIGEIFTTIAHEMIHVKQYMKENLGWFLDNRSNIPYLERWWEKEAFGNAVPLVEKFTKTLKNI